MDTFIGLGIVLKNNDTVEKEIENFLEYLEVHVPQLELSFPDEGNYDDWKTETISGNYVTRMDDFGMKDAIATMEFRVGDVPYTTHLTFSNEGGDMVIHLAFEDSFSNRRSIETLETITQAFTVLMEAIDNHLEYEYMFCDNEAEYVYKKERMLELGYNPYALLKLSDRQVVRAQWYLDGQTQR